MGFYSSSQIIQDAKRYGISVLNVDVQESHWDHYLVQSKNTSQPDLRLGLRLIKGLKTSEAYRIEKNQPFKTVEDLAKRASLNNQALRFLSRSGAMKLLSGNRYQSHWEVEGLHKPLSLEKGMVKSNVKKKSEFNLPAPSLAEDMIYDYKYLGLSLGPHPMKLLRKTKAFKNYCTAKELQNCRNAQFVKVAGIVTGRQRPGTANGILFLTIEDETGNINSVIKPGILARYRIPILQGQLLRLKGVVQREKEIIHFIPGYIEDVTSLLSQFSQNRSSNLFKPRNFH